MINVGMNELRSIFLDFFREKNHTIIDSFSLIPQDDPSLLLINAGMVPLKPYFTGDAKMPGNRAASSQRCIRTQDLENVGKTDRHGTFFEMLGNFSFGDYFKEEAITWAWEFFTERIKIDKDIIWVTVYQDDDEAYNIWRDKIGVPEERLVRLGKEDNFWELEVGPSGPCSEIHIDRGEKHGCGCPDCKPGCDCDRYMEVWNLVFSQYIKDEEGNYHDVEHPNIDAGMGLERLAMVVEEVDNIFEVDIVRNIINKVEDLSGIKYKEDSDKDISFRIISDHARSFTFLVMDGVVPSNEGRGYVLRRLIRRAIRHGILLGIEGNFLTKVSQAVMDSYGDSYPELEANKERIFKIITSEEEQFGKTIDAGLARLEELIKTHKENSDTVIPGSEAFKLYDTFGFPFDLTKEIAHEKDMDVDEEEFKQMMEEQKIRSRESREVDGGFHKSELIETEAPKTEFTGYTDLTDQAKILEIYVDGKEVDEISEGESGILIVDKTPFYGEGGGQIGDIGIVSAINAKAKVVNTQKNANETYFHFIEVTEGVLKTADPVVLEVDEPTRRAVMKNHSATHLLNQVLKEVLGDHIDQAGSYVSDERFRFDFTHFEAISDEELNLIEAKVNDLIAKNLKVTKSEMHLQEATKIGAIGLFEDKYKDIVRVVCMGDYSMELCGGTHIDSTSEIQMFKILSETGVSAGVRRIEAISGLGVYDYLTGLIDEREQVAHNLNVNSNNLLTRSHNIVKELKDKDKEIEEIKAKMRSSSVEDAIENKETIGDINYLTYKYDNMDMDTLRKLADQFRDKLGKAIVVLASVQGDKLTFVTAVSKDLISQGFNAGNIVRETAQITGGNGGGRPDFATAGGKDLDKVEIALENVKKLIEKGIK